MGKLDTATRGENLVVYSSIGGKMNKARRTEEELIQELKAKIEWLEHKAASRTAKKTEAIKHLIRGYLFLNKAVAARDADKQLVLYIDAAKATLEEYMREANLQVPKNRYRQPTLLRSNTA